MVTTKELLIERRVTVILGRTLFSLASSVLILLCYLCISTWPGPDELNVGFDDSYCTAWSRLKLSIKNGRSHALHCTVYQLIAFMLSSGWLTFSQGKSLYSYPMMGVRGTLHPFSRAFPTQEHLHELLYSLQGHRPAITVVANLSLNDVP